MMMKTAFVGGGLGAFSRAGFGSRRLICTTRPVMAISKGDKMPMDVDLMTLKDGSPTTVSTSTLFAGKKVALVTIPGAMTSTCQNSHVPQWIRAADEMKKKGVDSVVCLAVNDPFVMSAFEKAVGGGDKVTFVADGGAILTKKIGLEVDTGGFGGIRAKRAGFLVDDGVFSEVNVEEDGTGYNGPSKPETLLAQL